MEPLAADISKTVADNEDVIREELERYILDHDRVDTDGVDVDRLRADLDEEVTAALNGIYDGTVSREYAKAINQNVEAIEVRSRDDVERAAGRGAMDAKTMGAVTGGVFGTVVSGNLGYAVSGDPTSFVAAALGAAVAVVLIHGGDELTAAKLKTQTDA